MGTTKTGAFNLRPNSALSIEQIALPVVNLANLHAKRLPELLALVDPATHRKHARDVRGEGRGDRAARRT